MRAVVRLGFRLGLLRPGRGGFARVAPSALGLAALGLAAFVLVVPFCVARYPMMTDLPFHAANASVFRHYLDPTFHFREQFVLQPFAVPYMSLYGLAAAFMLVLSPLVAIKAAAVVMLALLPLGLAVLAWGMRKSPLLGLAGLGLAWGGLTSWGFLNFVGAIGLFAMVVGLALRALDRPGRGVRLALGLALVAVFFTHVFRYPFAVAAVLGCAVVMYPATGRLTPVLAPLVPSLVLFVVFWLVKPAAVSETLGPLSFEPKRLAQAGAFLYRSLSLAAEKQAATRALEWLGWLALGLVFVFAFVERRLAARRARDLAFGICSHAVVLACAGAFLGLYLVLPMEVGLWWYVYPREITAAFFVALGLLPDLPRAPVLRALAVGIIALAVVPLARLTIDAYARFDRATADFARISARLPQAPKLLYLVFDHTGSDAANTPFIHLPAYVQAERGGWLSFHFAMWGNSPVVYRDAAEPGAVVPPPVPLRWEWTPQVFRVKQHGAFFDWFLVRSRERPDARFAADPSVGLVAHEGSWWLYRRSP